MSVFLLLDEALPPCRWLEAAVKSIIHSVEGAAAIGGDIYAPGSAMVLAVLMGLHHIPEEQYLRVVEAHDAAADKVCLTVLRPETGPHIRPGSMALPYARQRCHRQRGRHNNRGN